MFQLRVNNLLSKKQAIEGKTYPPMIYDSENKRTIGFNKIELSKYLNARGFVYANAGGKDGRGALYHLDADMRYHEATSKDLRDELIGYLADTVPNKDIRSALLIDTENVFNSLFYIENEEYNIARGELLASDPRYDCRGYEDAALIPALNGLVKIPYYVEDLNQWFSDGMGEIYPYQRDLFYPAERGYSFVYEPLSMDPNVLFADDNPHYALYKSVIEDKKVLEYVLMYFATVLFAPIVYQWTFWFTGEGGSGKSSVFNGISAILGSLCSHAGYKDLIDRFGLSNIAGKRLNICDDGDLADVNITSLVKVLSQSSDIQVQYKGKDFRTITNTANLMFISNSFPNFVPDSAIRRRLQLIELNTVDKHTNLLDKFDRPDCVNWLFNACLYYWDKIKDMPPNEVVMLSENIPSMVLAKNEFMKMDSVYYWLRMGYDIDPYDKNAVRSMIRERPIKEVYADYEGCVIDEQGESPLSDKKLSKRLFAEYRLESYPATRMGQSIRVYKDRSAQGGKT